MNLPKMSIVMPVKNRQDTIEKAIRSVIEQHYDNVELIIMDGESTDSTVSIIKQYEQYISYWQSKKDTNPMTAANEGIARATGDIVGLLMADDQYQPGLFHRLAEAYQINPEADMFTCGGKLVRHNATQQDDILLRFETERSLRLSLYNICFASSAICCRFIKKSFYERIGLYPTADAKGKYIFSNDKIFLLRALLAKAKDIFVPIVGYHYLAHSGSTTFGRNRSNIMRMCEEHMDTAQVFLASQSLTLWQRLGFIYWYNDQSARLLVYQCLEGDIKNAGRNLLAALKKYTILWPLSFIVTAARIGTAKIFRLIVT